MLLHVRQLSFAYAAGPPVLREVDLTLAAGESVGLVGPNGAGKSTLLLHLVGLLPEPLPGESSAIEVLGKPVVRRHAGFVRQRIGLMFQDPDDQLFGATVLEDVAFGPSHSGLGRAEAEQVARAMLEAVGLTDAADRSPRQLSMGEKKRVCLAGVLACQPVLLALDEPSANLDPRGRRQWIELLGRQPAAKLIASHDLDMILDLCERVVLLDEGTIHADGPSRQVLGDAELMERHGLERPWRLTLNSDCNGAEKHSPR